MLGLFKRKKIENWEIVLLKNVLAEFHEEFNYLINQINDGLLKSVLVNSSDIPGYVGFTYNPAVLKIYNRENEKDFKLTNISIINSQFSYLYEIYVSTGTISGYALNTKKSIDVSKYRIDISKFRKEAIGISDYNRISDIFTDDERKLINPSNVYSVLLDNKEYFHIKDLEDGDFIGIDIDKNVYKITQDPYEITLLEENISTIFEN